MGGADAAESDGRIKATNSYKSGTRESDNRRHMRENLGIMINKRICEVSSLNMISIILTAGIGATCAFLTLHTMAAIDIEKN